MIIYALLPFLITVSLYIFYIQHFKRFGPVAMITERSLHKFSTPTGGGIVFSIVFAFSIFIYWINNFINDDYLLNIVLIAGASSVFGFIDDYFDIKAIFKLIFQFLVGVFIIFNQTIRSVITSMNYPFIIEIFCFLIILIIFVWTINVMNFVDGINGLASSSTIIISWTLAGIIFFQSGYNDIFYFLILLGSVCLGFFLFNFPKAYIFMGDSGTLFIGCLLGAVALKSILYKELSIWTWGTITGFLLIDTTFTTISRMILVKKWYGVHKSHAYQNLATIFDNHTIVTSGIILIHFIWIIPITILSALYPNLDFAFFSLSILPLIFIAVKFGPYYSAK